MKCPYCGSEMEKGIIQSNLEVSWSKKPHLFGNADFYDDSVKLAEYNFFKGSRVIAYLCRNCEKIVVDYSANCDANNE